MALITGYVQSFFVEAKSDTKRVVRSAIKEIYLYIAIKVVMPLTAAPVDLITPDRRWIPVVRDPGALGYR